MSNLFTKTEKGHTERGPALLISTIILFLSSFFTPFLLLGLVQDTLYHDRRSQWFFISPPSAYVACLIGMLWIPIVLTLHLIIQNKYEFKKMKWVTLLLILLSVPVLMGGITNYYYFDEKGVHYNSLNTLNEKTNEWSKLQEVKIVYSKNESTNAIQLDEYQFITEDKKVITVPIRAEFKAYENLILAKLKENNVKVTDNYAEQSE
ncbi:hypothetical protein [Neobacillus vireti]|uniref:Uncharacterized protein n=1 Tax=Neobacillus vireti LMG 21834 TaxID=1131730 RepID=A0AB94IL81_9BACI|nr:hypothetical protein [Neobacillus vireti]ETI67767.1 hypothetical protein BAVI_16007 [Neobacillus vireti LMG 21834]KLT16105.1 hypothetical protein AA980_19255 [Neobacillus vireti]